ncbi:hypothetical protein RF11_09167 [Thelohanellus kitauei]|uniref:Uncharacterized protein n=1 Tax=Thelohanellus kitauei TaxID=669202 RepID=A0A0C2JP86_THEKT|nr:hypothetical protein RF11_09167 [Thelohanellus kitauei]
MREAFGLIVRRDLSRADVVLGKRVNEIIPSGDANENFFRRILLFSGRVSIGGGLRYYRHTSKLPLRFLLQVHKLQELPNGGNSVEDGDFALSGAPEEVILSYFHGPDFFPALIESTLYVELFSSLIVFRSRMVCDIIALPRTRPFKCPALATSSSRKASRLSWKISFTFTAYESENRFWPCTSCSMCVDPAEQLICVLRFAKTDVRAQAFPEELRSVSMYPESNLTMKNQQKGLWCNASLARRLYTLLDVRKIFYPLGNKKGNLE